MVPLELAVWVIVAEPPTDNEFIINVALLEVTLGEQVPLTTQL